MNLNDFAKEVHQNAVEHGWWDEERSFGEIVALCHSELSEALEEYRAGRPLVYGDGFSMDRRITELPDIMALQLKPEGIAVELADCVIRILDWFGKSDVNVDDVMAAGENFRSLVAGRNNTTFGGLIADLHLCLSTAYQRHINGYSWSAFPYMGLCVTLVIDWMEAAREDAESILLLKHQYNKTRPYRHGGKAL